MSTRSTSLSLRNLRLSSASSLLRTPQTLNPSTSLLKRNNANATSKSSYSSIPNRTLKLTDIDAKQTNHSGESKTRIIKPKESRKERKKREWLERRNGPKIGGTKPQEAKIQSDWAYLPDLVLELIFQMLPMESRIQASLTCRPWAKILRLRSVWADLVIDDYSLTRPRFNFASKQYENVLDSVKASNALNKLAFKLRRIAFLPYKSLHNICQFQRMMKNFCQMYGNLNDIQSFTYVFPCDFARKNNEVDIYGTGGMILQDMKDLLSHLPGIRRLELKDLELDGVDASHVLDEVSEVCSERLRQLIVVNASRRPFSLLAVASFVNLRCLVISPHNLGDDLVQCIGDMPRLRNLQILTNDYSECVPTPVDYRVWKECRKTNPKLRVHLITEGKHTKELTFQRRAPVKSIVYDTPYTKASAFAINLAVDLYGTDLECYAHKRIPRFRMPKPFHDRADSAYLYLVRECPYIHTLMIRERISSSTVLLLAYTGKNLRYFHVRKNAVILRCEWPKNPEWSGEFYQWLRKNSTNYKDMEREVSQILGFRWYALNDKQFKLTPLNLNVPYYYEGFEEA